MKIVLSFLALIPTLCLAQKSDDNNAQFYLNRIRYYHTDDVNRENPDVDLKLMKELGIKSVTLKRNYKGKSSYNKTFHLNDLGRITQIIHPKVTVEYTYVNDSLISSTRVIGKKSSLTNFEYQNGKITGKEYFEKERLTSRLVVKYNEDESVNFSLLQKGRKLRNSYSMYYTYQDSKLENQRFMKNAKILKELDYKCKPEGEEVQAKNKSNVCKYVEENNDGSYIEYLRRMENNSTLLYKYYYTKDSVNYRSECFDEDEKMKWSNEIKPDSSVFIAYDKKGVVDHTIKTRYDDQHRMVEREYSYDVKGKRIGKRNYAYNDNGTMSNTQYYFKGKLIHAKDYEYAN